jgi:hypothetical protein
MKNEFQKIFLSLIVILGVSYLIDEEKKKNQPIFSMIKQKEDNDVSLQGFQDKLTNLDKSEVKTEINKLHKTLNSVQKKLEQEVDEQVDTHMINELKIAQETGNMSDSLVNILSSKLESFIPDLNPYDATYSAEGALFGKEDEGQIKFNDLPKFFEIKSQNNKPLVKHTTQPKPSNKTYCVDDTEYYNPSSSDQFGPVKANIIDSLNYHHF